MCLYEFKKNERRYEYLRSCPNKTLNQQKKIKHLLSNPLFKLKSVFRTFVFFMSNGPGMQIIFF